MKLKKSKKGSGLILVIMMFAFLSIVGMAFISMSLSSYKLRTAKSNAKTGLYGAESGIDEAYGIIGNKVDESIKKGNHEVDIFMNKLSEDLISAKNKIYALEKNDDYNSLNEYDVKDIIDEIEKGKNYTYLDDIKSCINIETYRYTHKKDNQQKQYARVYLDDSKVLESQNNIFKDKYTENILQENKGKQLNILEEISNCTFNINKEKPKIDAKIIIDKEEYSNFNDRKDYINKLKQNKKIPIRINSKFKYKGVNKQVKADYIINIPSYNKSYYVKEDNQIVHKNPVFMKAISIDGNMNVGGKVDIDGDVFVVEKDKKDDKKINKYNKEENNADKGIIINNIQSNFKGNVVTDRNFKIKGAENQCTVTGNIFANNVLLDKNATGSKLKVEKNVYTQDDLEIDANGSETEIQGAYYGLNNGEGSPNPGSSSSININAVKNGKANCKLDIKGEGSIIMGTAYADFEKKGEKYQTGESIAVKGNYKAYSIPSDKTPFSKYIFDYYKPIADDETDLVVGLISKDESSKDLNVFEKGKYFKNIVSNKDYKDIFNWDGIDINGVNCIHLGAIYTKENNEVQSNTDSDKFIIDNLNDVFEKIKEFNDEIYNMGEKIEYTNNINYKEVLSNSKKSVDTQLNNIENITEVNDKEDKNVIILRKGNITIESGKLNDKALDINNKNALIIVDGDLNIKGNLDFTGTLIVKGNLNIENGASLTIKYDENVVRSLISQNYGKLKNVFKNNSEEIFDTLNKTQFDMDGHSDIVLNNLIQMKNWKIVK
ncbi:hypothetical protein Z969_06350 [Clostridium novyi A str. 4570]|uniref:Type 4 fimbrial biogenesis protein PilX N-terminal domain-containing protein n=1 Tax=Clostridium novyi A str. 4570 TaxID=1444290 RepID=A0AA89CUS2_CLONO|nr:DUF2572 family protein [Clostridium novyi]KGN02257.1 hypothetical protein Z969_06350 [Clostridium novyi A str. 4570]